MSVTPPASRHSTHRQASRVQSRDMTARAENAPRRKDGGRCCRASCRGRHAASDGPRIASLLSRANELFQAAFDARQLFARAESAAPLGPFLQPLFVFTSAHVLLSHARLVLDVQGPFFENGLLPLLALLLAPSAGDIDRIHHQPMADARPRRTCDPTDNTLGGGDAREPRIDFPRQRGKLFDCRDERRRSRYGETVWT